MRSRVIGGTASLVGVGYVRVQFVIKLIRLMEFPFSRTTCGLLAAD